MHNLKVAAIQMDSQPGAVEANLARAEGLVEQAAIQGARLIVLPELYSTGYEYTDRVFAWPEEAGGQTGIWLFCRLARMPGWDASYCSLEA